jgi:hypothetical protein
MIGPVYRTYSDCCQDVFFFAFRLASTFPAFFVMAEGGTLKTCRAASVNRSNGVCSRLSDGLGFVISGFYHSLSRAAGVK